MLTSRLRGIRPWSLGLLALWSVCAWSPPVRAQESASVRDTAAARALFREGVACTDRRDWDCAADRFGRAYRVRPSPVLAYNLGHALIELGRLVEGVEILQQMLREDSGPDAVRADARRALEAAAPRIGRLTVHATGPTRGVQLSIDGHELASSLLGAAAPVDPGERLVEARRDGEVVASVRVRVPEGGAQTVELALPELPPDEASEDPVVATLAPSAVPTAAETARAAELAGATDRGGDDGPWIALGIGGAALVVGGAIVLAIVLAQPTEAMAFDGNLGHVEIGR